MSPRKEKPYSIAGHLQDEVRTRLALGVSIRQIAREAGINYNSIHYWMNGSRPSIKIETVDALCAYFGLVLRNR